MNQVKGKVLFDDLKIVFVVLKGFLFASVCLLVYRSVGLVKQKCFQSLPEVLRDVC